MKKGKAKKSEILKTFCIMSCILRFAAFDMYWLIWGEINSRYNRILLLFILYYCI